MQEHLVATKTGQTLLLQYHDEIPILADTFTQEDTTFWATYRWDLNPWILDEKGRTLSTSLYPLLKACTLADLQITRVAALDYQITLPSTAADKFHTIPKLGRWATAIIAAGPGLSVGGTVEISPQLQLGHGPEALQGFIWTLSRPGVARGLSQAPLDGGMSNVILHQTDNGIHWVIHRVSGVLPDVELELVRFQQRNYKRAFVFAAHPRLHRFPWCLNPTINNKHAIKALQRQPFLRAKRYLYPALTEVVQRLRKRVNAADGAGYPLQQLPTQLWHEGIIHIIWDCEGAAKCWAYFVAHWTRMVVHPAQLLAYKAAVLSQKQHQTYLRASERRLTASFGTRRGGSAGLGYESGRWRAPSASPPYGHSRTAGCAITRKQPPTKRNLNYNTASTATICSGQGTSVQPRRGRLYFFRLATELFFTLVSPRPFTQYEPGRQLTPLVGVLKRLETYQQSCKP
uniref:RxLR effector candidate protein n=1 Tax=Hyaloperonospora arabidopsidis (strain Emoy2) TaxID=559515 RepID=M4BIM6_HYAAE